MKLLYFYYLLAEADVIIDQLIKSRLNALCMQSSLKEKLEAYQAATITGLLL